MGMIKVILFDFGQTLVNSAEGFKQAEKEAQTWLFSDLFSTPNVQKKLEFLEVYRRIRKAFHDRSTFSRPAIWESVYRHFGKTLDRTDLEKREFSYWETVKRFTNPFPETMPVLRQLTHSHRLGLITNTQGQKTTGNHRIDLFPELEQFFDVIVVAGEEGIAPKPNVQPFHFCLKKMNAVSPEALYVGDDWRIDIMGAQNAGLKPVWLKHRSVKRNWPDVQNSQGPAQVPVITGLDQLPPLVASL